MSFVEAFDSIVANSSKSIPINEGDYIGDNGLLYCGKCNTPKQTEVKFQDEIRRPYCLCKCETEKEEAEEEEKKKAEFERKVNAMRKSGFPDADMLNWTFANDDMENERITKAMRKYVDNFSEFRKQGKGLLLYGNVGRGKTYAACEVANALIDKGIPVLVTNFARIVNTLQGTFEKQEYIDSLNKYALLVIDDLSAERDTTFMKEQVFQVIDARYRAKLPMIITTNLSLDEIKKTTDLEYGRIYDRIIERCFPIEYIGINRRHKAVRETYGDMKDLLGL